MERFWVLFSLDYLIGCYTNRDKLHKSIKSIIVEDADLINDVIEEIIRERQVDLVHEVDLKLEDLKLEDLIVKWVDLFIDQIIDDGSYKHITVKQL
jgi:hypothetical protein